MGIKDNFQQALRELTGTDKEEKQQRDNKSIDAMKNAVAAGDTSEFDAIRDVSGDTSSYDEIERRAAAAADEYNRQQSAFIDTPAPQQSSTPETSDVKPADPYIQPDNPGAYNAQNMNTAAYGASQQNNGYQQQNTGYQQQNTGYQQQNTGYQQNMGYQQSDPGAQQTYFRPGDPGFGTGGAAAPRSDPAADQFSIFSASRYQHPVGDDDEITVISKNTVIDGNVRSFANMSVDGNIKGNIETTKDIDINGKVVGNIACNNAQMRVSQIQGNIQMKGNAYMERDTLLIGDLTSTYANVNGKIKGNLDITGKAELKSDAVVFGDISASTITVNDGAIIQGYVSTTFLNKEESKNIFPDTITIGD